jgi:hypothetical protein
MLLEQATSEAIAKAAAAKHGTDFDTASIERYRKEAFGKNDSPLQQVVKITKDLTSSEPPPLDEFGKLSFNFSFKKTNDDLELIYDRIRYLRGFAEDNPEDSSYDRRIKEYMSQAEAIRTRVFRQQYEQIRHAILLTVGKKLCMAAISILMPYIHKDFRDEAMRRFQAAVEPLLDLKAVPDIPKDMADSEQQP